MSLTTTLTENVSVAASELATILPTSSSATRHSEHENDRTDTQAFLPRWQAALIITTVGLMTMMSTVLSGVLAVALPKIAETLGLEESLLLWYSTNTMHLSLTAVH